VLTLLVNAVDALSALTLMSSFDEPVLCALEPSFLQAAKSSPATAITDPIFNKLFFMF
jgi:hypothetical protein